MMRCDRRGVRGAEVWAALPTDADASRYPAWWLVLGSVGCGGNDRRGEYFACGEAKLWQTMANPCPRGQTCTRCQCSNSRCSQYRCVGGCVSTPGGSSDLREVSDG